MKKRIINVIGYEVEVFEKIGYMYPVFNRGAEFPITKQGFKALYHYLRNVNRAKDLLG